MTVREPGALTYRPGGLELITVTVVSQSLPGLCNSLKYFDVRPDSVVEFTAKLNSAFWWDKNKFSQIQI